MKKELIFKIIAISALLVLTAAFLSGCAPGDGKNSIENPAGFFWGIWHGWIAPVSLIISIFRDNINIYEVHNTGFGYNLGFYMAIVGGPFGLSLSRKKRR